MSTRERIRQIIERWFLIEPLLFSVCTTHQLVIEPRIATIRVRRGRIEYNPDFILSLHRRQLEAVLRGEALRILLKHPYQRRKENRKLSYLASNITLQEYLRTELPLPYARDIFGSDEFDRQYFEFYYYKLQEFDGQEPLAGGPGAAFVGGELSELAEQGVAEAGEVPGVVSRRRGEAAEPEPGEPAGVGASRRGGEAAAKAPLVQYADSGVSGVQNTADWDVDEFLSDLINEQIRIAQESHAWGSVAGQLRESILATLKPKLDYRAVLRLFRATILSTNRILTRMKASRRYGFLYMGSRHDFATRLLFAVDVSGSISRYDLAIGFSIINSFFKSGVSAIDVIQFDTEIKGKPLKLKRARYEIVVEGRGGTSFAPVIDYIEQHREYDGLILFTDGYAPVPPTPKNRHTRILWLFNHQSNYERMRDAVRPIGQSIFLRDSQSEALFS